MSGQVEREPLKSDLTLHWVIVGVMLAMLASYVIVCHTSGEQLQQPLPEDRRILFRSIFYVIAIVTLPLTNLIRHIQLRLNQTMPYSPATQGAVATAKSRYLTTVLVSMALVEVVGVFGLIMFMLGDGFNTLYIFTGLSALGLFLYRPKVDEYSEIIDALSAQDHE